MCGEHVPLDRMLSAPLWNGLSAERVTKTVDALLRKLSVRICSKCGKEAEPNERFCQACGTWLSRTIISLQELEKCLSRVSLIRGFGVQMGTQKLDERQKIFRLLDRYEKK
jgi:zinc-ribbon domain